MDPLLEDNALQCRRRQRRQRDCCFPFLSPFLGSSAVDYHTSVSQNAKSSILLGGCEMALLQSLFSISSIEILFLDAVVLGFKWKNLTLHYYVPVFSFGHLHDVSLHLAGKQVDYSLHHQSAFFWKKILTGSRICL